MTEVATQEQVAAALEGAAGLCWRYVSSRQARAVHAVDGQAAPAAVCGMGPAWWRRNVGWAGAGSPGEYALAAALPRCLRCVRALQVRFGSLFAVAVRPKFAEPQVAEFYDWLAGNQIREWLPENPVISITSDAEGDWLTYTSYQWYGPRGWDSRFFLLEDEPGGGVRYAPWVDRTVPLLAAPTQRIRELAIEMDSSRWQLVEHLAAGTQQEPPSGAGCGGGCGA